jgi:Kef-type K+ transport system membrane component KefB
VFRAPLVPDVSFTGLLLVSAAAFVAPLALALVPGLRVPAVVLEIVLGIFIGPSGLHLASVDPPLQVLSLLGLAYLLFLAGMEIEFERLRGEILRRAGFGFLGSLAVAVPV